MVDVLTAAAALLLVVSGTAKLRQPADAAAMILRLARSVRATARHRHRLAALVRGIGLGEIAVGLAVLVTGSRIAAALLAVAYLTFLAVAVGLLRTGGTRTSCGCFGRAESPLGTAHLVLNLVAAGAGVAAVARPPGPGCGLGDGGSAVAAASGLQAVLLAVLAYLCVTSLPALLAARRALATPSPREP